MLTLLQNLLLFIFLALLLSLETILIIPFYLFSKNKHRIPQFGGRLIFQPFFRLAGIRIKIEGKENLIGRKGVILVSNHQGIIDIPVLILALPIYFRFLALQDLFKIPILGINMKMRGDLPLERKNKESARQTIAGVASLVKSGESVLIFPEGVRSFDGSLGDFRSGAVVVAQASGAPVIPIAIAGSFHVMPRHSYLISPGRITVKIGSPLYFNNNPAEDKQVLEENLGNLRKKIAEMLKQLHTDLK